MIIYPAIDLCAGKVVRLREGDPQRQIIFGEDPLATAKSWVEQGARWLHMVNLDGAFDLANENQRILEAVAKLDAHVQFGGGLRDMDSLQNAYDSGADRLVIGTMAVNDPAAASAAIKHFGVDAICVALDAKDGKVTTHGWTSQSAYTPIELGKQLRGLGARHALYTDVKRDGGMSGVNIDETVALGRQTGLRVIASGGVSTLRDIEKLARSRAVAGAIIGMALYQNKLALADALEAAEDGNSCWQSE